LQALDLLQEPAFASNLLGMEPPQKSTYVEYAYFFSVSMPSRFFAKAEFLKQVYWQKIPSLF
jgi:hypothetical protein